MTGLKDLIKASGSLISISLGILVGAALLVFLWGLARSIMNGEKGAEEGKGIMTWGLTALFVMASLWGIVAFMQRALDLNFGSYGGKATKNAPTAPNIPLAPNNPLLTPGNAPQPGNLPIGPTPPWYDRLFIRSK